MVHGENITLYAVLKTFGKNINMCMKSERLYHIIINNNILQFQNLSLDSEGTSEARNALFKLFFIRNDYIIIMVTLIFVDNRRKSIAA